MIAKRLFDLAAALIALPVFLPVMLVIALACLMAQGRPILFRQRRIGKGGAPFDLFKVRTMREAYDAEGRPLPDDERITGLGALLRRYRLDELPAFLLILTGRMSMVGPRPLPTYVLDTIEGSAARSAVPPGFTGLAQVSGNTALTNNEKLALDLHYIAHRSFAMDIGIILRTLLTLVRGERRDEPLIAAALAERRRGIGLAGS